jgi:hypothetical protein
VTPNSNHFGHLEEDLQTSNPGYHKEPNLETISDNKEANTKCGKTHQSHFLSQSISLENIIFGAWGNEIGTKFSNYPSDFFPTYLE